MEPQSTALQLNSYQGEILWDVSGCDYNESDSEQITSDMLGRIVDVEEAEREHNRDRSTEVHIPRPEDAVLVATPHEEAETGR